MAPIDLQRGHPSTRLLAIKEIQAAAQKVLSREWSTDSFAKDANPLCYGPDLGNLSVRTSIAAWAASKYHISPAPPSAINITSGASNGLALALTCLTSPITGYTRRVFIVSPTYFLACSVFQDCGFSQIISSVAMTESGKSVDFDSLLKQLQEDKTLPPQPPVTMEEGMKPIKGIKHKSLYKYVMYLVPTFANPTGTTLSLEARERLVKIAREWDILLLSDDVYDFLGYDQSLTPPKRLVDIDRELDGGVKEGNKGNTLSNCSFSKLLGPGLRCGWLESVNEVLVTELGESGANHSGGAPSQFTSTLIETLLTPLPSPPIDTVISNITKVYTHRAALIRQASAKYLPKGTEIDGGEGGYFMWIRFPSDYDARAITKLAAEKVIVLNGDMVECPDLDGKSGNKIGWGERCVRIAVTYQEDAELEDGIRFLGEAAKAWEESKK